MYCKRLRLILPEIMAQCNPDYTTRELKGNTALHYACSLSHVGLVQWQVNHGAEGVLFQCVTDIFAAFCAELESKTVLAIS